MINVYNSQKGEILYNELADFIKKEGYAIVRIRINKNRKIRKCQIMIEKTNNEPIGIMDCEKVNKEILQVFRNKHIGFENFDIEVSSPGINRPLTRLKDYIESKGKMIKVYTLYKIQNKRNFRCYIKAVDEGLVKAELVDTGEVITLSFDSISEAYLEYES